MDKQFFGAFLDLTDRLCVVIGGGRVAERKIQALLTCGAHVRVIAPDLTPVLAELAARGRIEYVNRVYREGDTHGAFLTIAATDSTQINQMVVREADSAGRLVNAVHVSDGGNMFVPAVVRRGPLQVAISTSGTGPAVARLIREELESHFGQEYELYLNKLAAVRNKLMTTIDDEAMRTELLHKIARSNVRELLRAGQEAEADRIIQGFIEG